MYKGVLFSPQFMMLYASKISVLQHTIKVVAYTTKQYCDMQIKTNLKSIFLIFVSKTIEFAS